MLTALGIAISIFVVLPAAFVFLADPCHVFHKPFPHFLHHGFTPSTRCQNAGLINSWLSDKEEGFDSLLIGASTSENFLIPYINQKTQWKRTLKLEMVNMFPVEQNILLTKSLASGNIHHVFLEISPMLHHAPKSWDFGNIGQSEFFPAYLYNSSRLDDYSYIFNFFTLSGSVDILTHEPYYVDDINKILYWEDRCASMNICDHYYKKDAIEKIQQQYVPVIRKTRMPIEKRSITYRDFDNFIYPVIRDHCNKDVSFDIFFPPFSLLWFSQLTESEFDFELYLLRHTLEKTSHCKNVRIFAFYNTLWITADLSNYSDPKHFYADIHKYMTDAIATDQHRITKENIDAFEETMIMNLNSYRPYGTKLYLH
jgi:hypothetical protein